MKTRRAPKFVAYGASFLCALQAQAQAAKSPSEQTTSASDYDKLGELSLEALLEPGVVTASGGVEEEADLSSANVFVYTRQDFLNHGWRSLAEALAHVPGLYVIDDLVTPTVTIRGASGGFRSATRIVKVMINGVDVSFRPDMTAFIGPEYIPVDVIDRMEVAKGPLSAVYGANAFLATVNVVTATPRDDAHAAAGVRAFAFGKRGQGAWVTASYGSPRVSVLLAAAQESVDRSGLAVERSFPRQNPATLPYRPFFSSPSQGDLSAPQTTYAEVRLSPNKRYSVRVQGGLQRQDAMGEFQSSSALTHASRYSISNLWSDLRFDAHLHGISPWLRLGWAQGEPTRDDLQYTSESSRYAYARNFNYRALSTRGGLVWSRAWLGVAADMEYTHERHRILYYTQIYRAFEGELEPGDRVDVLPTAATKTQRTMSNLAWHGQVVVNQLVPGLRIALDGRVDRSEDYPTEWSWRAVAGYRWRPGVTTRLVAGRAFQGPSAVLLYSVPGFGSSSNIFGNRTVPNQRPLVPQTVSSVELIQSVRVRDLFELTPSFFYQELDRSIEFASNGLGYIAKNGGKRRSVGAELASKFTFGRVQSEFAAAVLWPLVPAENRGPVDRLAAPPLYPKRWALLGIQADLPELYLRPIAVARWVSERGPTEQNLYLNDNKPYALSSYLSLDVGVRTVKVRTLGAEEAVASIFLRNVTGQAHTEPGPVGADLPSIGRVLELSLQQAF